LSPNQLPIEKGGERREEGVVLRVNLVACGLGTRKLEVELL
jgi:hypothetical protein